MFLWVGIKGQTGLQVALEALGGGRVDLLILFDESGDGLISRLPVLLIEQGPQLMPIAIILSLLAALIAHCANEGIDFGFQHTDTCCSHGLLQFRPQQRCKGGLTFVTFLRIVLLVSRWYPPLDFS